MQLDFNHIEHLPLRPLHRLSRLWCLSVALVLLTVNSAVYGQTQRLDHLRYQNWHRQGIPQQPRHFGDTPSPTEMMARLKLHKQQETPLFDLLREAGDDIFSKLSDDEKKLAGRFLEDMILKEGMDSDKVSSLMEHMNINDAAKQALKDGIERAAGDSVISPEDRKKLANQIRKQFLEKSGNQEKLKSPATENWPDSLALSSEAREKLANHLRKKSGNQENLQSPTTENWQQPNQQSDSARRLPSGQNPLNSDAEQVAGEFKKTFDKNRIDALQRLLGELRKQPPIGQGQQRAPASEEEIDLSKLKQKLDEEFNRRAQADPQLPQDGAVARNTIHPDGDATQITGEQAAHNSRQPDIASNSQPQSPPRDVAPPKESTAAPNTQPLNKLLTQETFRQLEKQLSEPQQKVASELKDKIQNGNVSKQDIDNLFSDLQSSQSPDGLAKQLDEVGKSMGLPADSREEVQEAFSQLSDDQQRSLQQTLNGINKQMLSDLMGRVDKEKFGTESSASSSPQTASSPSANTDLANTPPVDLGREFLQDALETYSDPDSGYELSHAFQQLKDQAEGVNSGRKLANLGNLSKQLFEDSSNIFKPGSTSEAGKKQSIKPGQRFDQLLASAASKAIVDNAKRNKEEGDSVLSDVLNQALGVAIDQAVTAADNGLENRSRDVPQAGLGTSELSSGWPNQLDFPKDLDLQPHDNAAIPPTDNFTNGVNSSESSLQDSAERLGDAFSDLQLNWQTIFYAALIIVILAGVIFILSQFMQPVSEEELQHRELRRKLKTSSANPKDLVEAVDLFLLSRFGAASSWWNAKHAAAKISDAQPDWRDKVGSLFQIYRWSRYQADGQTSVSPEQNDLVKSTLRELSRVPIESFDKSKASQNETQDVAVDAEGKS